MSFTQRSGLYAIVDADALAGADPLAFADVLLESAPLFALQLRAKRWSARQIIVVARALAQRCARAGVPFVVNDRADLAVIAGAHALHVGQEDLSVLDARRIAGASLIGVSTHDLAQLDEALALAPDYVAFGPVFETRSKEAPDPTVGLALLERACERARAAAVPLVAIGGITVDNAASVRAAGASSGAVIGALASRANDPRALASLARSLHDALSR
ncbi:MAG: thiamine phosphate synthase [Polyangiales bacterium]